MFHSQHGIEHYLNKFFDVPGFFLEIGCWDGERISQTAWLERERGWTGLCVDPFPVNFERRSCRVCAKAVVSPSPQPSPSGRGSMREFVKVSIDRRHGGDVSYFSGFKDSINLHWDVIEKYCDYEIVQVETITMGELYEQYDLPNYIEFLSIDTEGSELEILASIDFGAHQFGMIMLEHNMNEKAKWRAERFLFMRGYQRIESLQCDDIYVSRELLNGS